jgi:propanol-preferring alcohol dehydrogenase
MIAMQLQRIANLSETTTPLQLVTLPEPSPAEDEILIKVSACGVCHTELDEIEGRTPPPELPIIPGHQVVGRIVGMGKQASIFSIGDRVGVAWIYSACGSCEFCLSGRENLCQEFCATGRDINGGYAQYMIAKETFALRIPEVFPDTSAAPLLCAGAVGFRSLRLANIINGQKVGFSGFGASAHIVLQLVRKIFPNSKIFVFTRNPSEQAFALDLGAYRYNPCLDANSEKSQLFTSWGEIGDQCHPERGFRSFYSYEDQLCKSSVARKRGKKCG